MCLIISANTLSMRIVLDICIFGCLLSLCMRRSCWMSGGKVCIGSFDFGNALLGLENGVGAMTAWAKERVAV